MEIYCIVDAAVHGDPMLLGYFAERYNIRYPIWIVPYPSESLYRTHLVGGGDSTVAVYSHVLIVRCLFGVGEKGRVCNYATSCAAITHDQFSVCLAVITSDVASGLLFV